MSRGNSASNIMRWAKGAELPFSAHPELNLGCSLSHMGSWQRHSETVRTWEDTVNSQHPRPGNLLPGPMSCCCCFSLVFEEHGILKRRYNVNLISSNFLLFKIEQKGYWISSTYQSSCSLWHLFSSWNNSVNILLLTCSSLALLPRVPGKKNTQGNTGLRSRCVHTSS